MNSLDEKQYTEPARIFIIRTIVVGIILIVTFAIPYYSPSFFQENLVALKDAFKTGLIYLAISITASAVAIYIRRNKKSKLTRIFITATALMTIGSFLLFYSYYFQLVGKDVTTILLPQSGLGEAIIITSLFALIAVAKVSLLLSWWLLPLYRHLSHGEVIHTLRAAVLAVLLLPLFGFLVNTPSTIQELTGTLIK